MRFLTGFAATLILAAGLAACSSDPGPGPIRIETDKVALYPDMPERLDVGVLEYRGGLVLTSPDDRFGGLSGMEIEGDRLLAISDSAYWLTTNLEFDDAGLLTGLSNAFYAPMLDANGQPLVDRAADAEGLAALGNGAYAVSFEREHRMARYDISPDWSGSRSPRRHPSHRRRARTGCAIMAGLKAWPPPIMASGPAWNTPSLMAGPIRCG